MGVKRRDDIVVAPINGGVVEPAADGRTATLGVFLECRGVAVAAASATVTAVNGSTSVDLTPDISTSGQVTAPITDANFTTLGVGMLQGFDVFFSGTIADPADGTITHNWEYQLPVVITDREVRFPVLYADLKRQIPQLRNPATTPQEQSNYWDQCRLALEAERNWIDRKGSSVRNWLIANPAQFRELCWEAAKVYIYNYMAGSDNNQSHLVAALERAEKRLTDLRAEIAAAIKSDARAWETSQSQDQQQVQPARFWFGDGTQGWGGYI